MQQYIDSLGGMHLAQRMSAAKRCLDATRSFCDLFLKRFQVPFSQPLSMNLSMNRPWSVGFQTSA